MSTSAPPPSSRPAPPPQGAVCGACGTPADPRAAICPRCGLPRPGTTAPGLNNARSAGRAMLYSLLWPGAGHLYASDPQQGLVFTGISSLCFALSLTVFSVGVSVILWLVTAIYTMVDVSQKVRAYNAEHGLPT